ncbi:MAG: hypothetical protein IT297_03475 [Anaerolineae bacterium]|jgi:hypothetical protein|nr:hypothetical protein [Anaerolineae bacterium]MCZ7553497.1 hypothetical protein [Anaerolineales bacterium]
MNEPEKASQNAPLHSLEPFPQVNTYPKGWLVDSIPTPGAARTRVSEPLPAWFEPFSEPNTYPKGWSG